MRLLVEIGYNKILFGKGAKISELLEAFDGIKIIQEEGGYSEPKRYIIDRDTEVSVRLINDDSVSLPENQTRTEVKETLEMFHKLKDKNEKLETENKELKEQLEKITETISNKKEEK
ncbi:MAG TPA: hypothetical protein ENN33_07110 [Ignavibacteria bacterium]|nr:hypothetical protein [Ignavibacteria bacterium]